MKIVDKRLRETADIINKKLAKVNEENRSEVSADVLSHLRNFCEAFMYKVIIIVDEASFVSTDSIEKIIGVYESSAFIFVGDPGQIESIEFGNWFNLLLNLLKVKDVVLLWTLNTGPMLPNCLKSGMRCGTEKRKILSNCLLLTR